MVGVIEEPDFDIPDLYSLGEMMVDVPYVIRQCQEDKDYYEGSDSSDSEDGRSLSDSDSDVEEEDRGVSGAMANVYDPEQRIHMLLVHGMLHLVGHDHEEDDEYELMVQKEEELLQQLSLWPADKPIPTTK